MHRTTRSVLLVAAALTLLFSAGCTVAVAGAAAPAGGPVAAAAQKSDDPVAWVDSVCGAFLSIAEETRSGPPVLDPKDSVATSRSLSRYLGSLATALGTAVADLKKVGPSPVEGGDEAVTKLTSALEDIQKKFQSAKSNIDAADPTDKNALKEAIRPLAALADLPDPTDGLKANAQLDQASAKAPNCRAIPGAGG